MKTVAIETTYLILNSLVLFMIVLNIGNVAYAQSLQYDYDSLKRLTEIHRTDKIIRFTYDDAGNRTSTTVEILTAAPSAASLVPNNTVAGGSDFTLTVNGNNFSAISVVQWNGSNRATTLINSTQLQATIPASDIASFGTASVTVLNQTSNIVSNAQTFTITPSAQDAIAVSLPAGSGSQGTVVTIPVNVGNLNNQFASAYIFNLNFDPAVLQPAATPFAAAGTLSSKMTVTANTATPGSLRIEAFQTTPLVNSGTLINLRFNVVGASATNTPLTWQLFQFNEGDPFSISSNGQFTVAGPAASVSVSGRALTNDGRIIRRAMITIVGPNGFNHTVLTNQQGIYRIGNVLAGETYTFTIFSKQYTFANPVITRQIVSELTDLNFISQQ